MFNAWEVINIHSQLDQSHFWWARKSKVSREKMKWKKKASKGKTNKNFIVISDNLTKHISTGFVVRWMLKRNLLGLSDNNDVYFVHLGSERALEMPIIMYSLFDINENTRFIHERQEENNNLTKSSLTDSFYWQLSGSFWFINNKWMGNKLSSWALCLPDSRIAASTNESFSRLETAKNSSLKHKTSD